MELEQDSKTGLLRLLDHNFDYGDVFNFSHLSVVQPHQSYSNHAEMSVEQKMEDYQQKKQEIKEQSQVSSKEKSKNNRRKKQKTKYSRHSKRNDQYNKKDRLSNLKELTSIAKLIYQTTDDYSYSCLCQNMKDIQSVYLNRPIEGKEQKSLKRRLYDICNVAKSIRESFPDFIAQQRATYVEFEILKDNAHETLYQTVNSCLDMAMKCMMSLLEYQEICVGTNQEEKQMKHSLELLMSLTTKIEEEQKVKIGQIIKGTRKTDN